MRTAFVPIAFLFTLSVIFAEYEESWKPITNEEAYRRLNINIPTSNNLPRIDRPWYQNTDSTDNKYTVDKNDAIKLIEPKPFNDNFEVQKFNVLSDDNDTNSHKNKTIAKKINLKYTRKAKKMNDDHFIKTVGKTANDQDIKNDYRDADYINKDIIENNESKSYKVTQSSEIFDQEPVEVATKLGYVYFKPETDSNKIQNNFTSNFLNILDKYNIYDKDKLTNYEKSRVANIQHTKRQPIFYLPLPSRLVQRYNSLNHLPVDPLIAVFLSNYGHYLPYTYGIHNNYKNLYGYLASNNIHNNKPFGNYKIFSDTDSSN